VTALIALWVALLATDRIDLLAGQGGFVLTPYLVLTPLVCLFAVRERMHARHPVVMTGRLRLLLITLLLLVTFVTASVFVSMELARSAMRAMQLVAMAFGVLAVRVLVPVDALTEGLVRGARWGIGLYAVLCVLQLLALLSVIPASIPSDALPLLKIAPSLHGGLLPRLSGGVVDSNRSGLLLVTYAALLLWHDWRRHVGMLATAMLFLLLTLSRSSMLAGAAALVWQGVVTRRHNERAVGSSRTRALPAIGVLGASLVVFLASVLLYSPRLRDEAATVLAPIAERFTVAQGSGEDHLRLLARGMATATRSIPTALQGIGYGSGYLVLQDFFPGDKYGNFHSVYVGIFAESGVFALVVTVLLIAVPLVLRTPQAPLAAAVAVFGVFYAALAEPTFWLAVVLAWLPVSDWLSRAAVSRARPKATKSATAIPNTAPSAS
jgi:hypothetical protein